MDEFMEKFKLKKPSEQIKPEKIKISTDILNCIEDIIITIDSITMVNLDVNGKPTPHGKTKIEYVKDRINDQLKQLKEIKS